MVRLIVHLRQLLGGRRLAATETDPRKLTFVIASFPVGSLARMPTASSWSSTVNRFLQAMARNVSMWQLERLATNASSGSTHRSFPRYAGFAEARTVIPASIFYL